MILFESVGKAFGPKTVLEGMTLEVPTGGTTVIIGQSGSGKSVSLKLLIGILAPDAGRILLDGRDLTAMDAETRHGEIRRFGMLFQGAALFDSMTVAENVAFGLDRHTCLTDEEKRQRVGESLEKVGLRNIEGLMPYELSGGMKKRVGLARAIAYRPEIMLYDEPSTGIDPIRADAINDLINLLKSEMGVTSIVITHDMVSAYKVADRIAMLYQGRIVATGTPDEIRDSDNPIVQQFINGRAAGPITNW
jgi:phospholipid/cholesterol/gamma-HCH transport system ATP-binding protein